GNPKDPLTVLIMRFDDHSTALSQFVTPQKSNFGWGGMVTKGRIARNTAESGIAMAIANGTRVDFILVFVGSPDKVPHTLFVPGTPRPAVKQWMAYSTGFASSEVVVNEGAEKALFSHKASSLLLAGVVSMNGDFEKGDLLR